MSEHDYSDYREAPKENILARIAELAHQQLHAEREVAKAEEELKARREELRQIAEHDLPALMDEAAQLRLTTSDRLIVAIEETIRGSIPVANREAAVAWLDEHGHSNLVDREYKIRFGREDEKWARQFEAQMRRRKKPLPCRREVGVHHSRLKGWVREQLAAGVQIPMELFGVYRQRVAKVKLPRSRAL